MNAARSGVYTVDTRITAANVGSLTLQQVPLDGTADSSPIFLHAVSVNGALHDVFFVTTTYGRTEAIDAANGTVLWEFTPPGYNTWAGTAQITTATPVADPTRLWIYAASPGGVVYKLTVATGAVVWGTSITESPAFEKIASALNFANGHVIATTGGYIGDAPPYQGHVAVLDAGTGSIVNIWNSLCSDRSGLIDPSSCDTSDSAIWGRAGAVVDPATGDLLVSTGNGPWDGKTNWGDAVIRLSPDAGTMLGNYTPANTAFLNADDLDLGSTSPVILDATHIVQGGKDAKIRVISTAKMSGTTAHKGGELQIVPTPSGSELFTAPMVWAQGSTTMLFAADYGATEAWKVSAGRLTKAWRNGAAGTSPLVAGGLLWVYDPYGGLNVYDPATGDLLTTLSCGGGHWNSPIVVPGRVALPEGNANDHDTTGVLDIWRLP